MGQLFFEFAPQPDYSAHQFIVGETNRAAADLVQSWPEWRVPVAMLVGPGGVGKTHLAHIWQAHAGGLFCPAGQLADGFNPIRYAAQPTVVDDAHSVAGKIGAERALLHLYNLCLQNKQTLLMTAAANPQHWGLLLPDLASRLRAAMVVEIRQPDDAMMRQLYAKLFADRQLSVPLPVIDWLLQRIERSATTAGRVVAALDAAALEAQKPISIYLARKVLGDEGED